MSLFQNSVLNKYLKGIDSEKAEKAWDTFKTHFHNPEIQENIRNSKEEQYQGEFLIDLFVNVFGYVKNPNPNFNLTTELKNIKGAKKTDGAILQEDKAIAVIELKGTNTVDLAKVENQAFGYKNNQPGCTYVITSNFGKLRFYIDNAVEYEEFNLFQLTKERFETLYLCLAEENLLKGIPKQIKDESLTREETVTKQLYKDYSQFRNEIFDDIQKQNPEYDKLTLFKKTQKLLDRFLFIFFAEDRLLLPPNSIREIVTQWTDLRDKYDEYQPLYSRFKKYFGYMNTGYEGKKYEIFAYNGGLFAPDEILDTIKISDELLYKHTVNLSNYDFESEVSVNILGHIFEHSLTETETIQAQLEGQEIDKSKTKRKKDGVFYTPKYITKYIVDNTVGKLCEEKKEEFRIDENEFDKERKGRKKATLKKLSQQLDDYRSWLLQITICDPACGSGAFLNQALEFLIEEHRYIDELKAKLLGDAMVFSEVQNDILENNIYGVDINEESVEIAKLSLWLRTAKKGRKLTILNDNIKCGNSLIDDSEVANNKEIDWKKEFTEVFANGGFDIIIGNPPYVSKSFGEIEKRYYHDKYLTAQYQLDLYISFMELGTNILSDNGKISYIVPNSWLKNLMFDKCRLFVLNNLYLDEIVPNLENIFTDASVDTLIFVATKSEIKNKSIEIGYFENSEFIKKHTVDQNRFIKNEKYIFDVEIAKEAEPIFKKILEKSVKLFEISDVTRGINPYDKYRGQDPEVIKNKLYHSDHAKDETFVPEIRGKHVNRYSLEWDGTSYVSYGKWLAAPREPKYFEGNRIVCRQVLGKNLNCTLVTVPFIIDQSVFIAKFDNEQSKKIDPKFVLSQLTSKLIGYFFRFKANEFDALFPKIKIGEYKNLPVVVASESKEQLINLTDKMLDLNSTFHTSSKKFNNYIISQFSGIGLTKKLQAWHDLDFGDYIKELNKAIRKAGGNKLTKSDEMEWMELFETKKSEALTLKTEIEKIDQDIDGIIYKMYELTEEEIRIVEAATA